MNDDIFVGTLNPVNDVPTLTTSRTGRDSGYGGQKSGNNICVIHAPSSLCQAVSNSHWMYRPSTILEMWITISQVAMA